MEHTLEATTSEAATIAELAADTVDRAQEITPTVNEVGDLTIHQTVHRDGENVHQATHEAALAYPSRPRGTTELTDIASFIRMEKRLNTDQEQTATFADDDRRTLTTVFNYQAGWGDHRLTYQPVINPDFAKWLKQDNQWMNQATFAEMLQDLRHTIISPAAADIVQIARTFTATKTAEFESGVRLQSGDVQFSFAETTRARSGGTIEIPETITLRLLPFRDSSELVDVELDFRYDASSNGLKLGYHIVRKDELMEDSWNTILDFAREHLSSTVYTGKAPAHVPAMS